VPFREGCAGSSPSSTLHATPVPHATLLPSALMSMWGLELWITAVCFAALTERSESNHTTTAPPPYSDSNGTSSQFLIPDVVDINSLVYQVVLPLFPAKVTDIFPTSPIVGLRLSNWDATASYYKMRVCEKAKILDCMPFSMPHQMV
jgi:hypothetical protein